MKKNLFIEIISGAFIFLFVYAAVSKLMDMEKFAAQIGQSPILTDMNYFIAWFIPLSEIGISLLLARKVTRLIGLYASFGMMVLFTAYITAILSFSEHIPCSCGGVLERLTWKEHLAFNSIFIGLAGVAIIILSKQKNRKYHVSNT